MKALRLVQVLGAVAMVVWLAAAPIQAKDQALQAILAKLRCAPSKVVRTDLAAGVATYEVTCKGRDEVVFILCQGVDCRQVTRRRDAEETETPM